jgi:hypothetical protein
MCIFRAVTVGRRVRVRAISPNVARRSHQIVFLLKRGRIEPIGKFLIRDTLPNVSRTAGRKCPRRSKGIRLATHKFYLSLMVAIFIPGP